MSANRMSPDEYFWHYEFRFDLRDATRGEQAAVRTLFLAQKRELDGFTPGHVALVELVLGHASYARDRVFEREYQDYKEQIGSRDDYLSDLAYEDADQRLGGNDNPYPED